MRWAILTMFLLLAACTSAPASGPGTDVPDRYPTQMPTPTLAVQSRAIGEDEIEEAFHFFYELKNLVALGEYEHFAEEVRYPITVVVDGQPKTFVYAAELEADFEKVFDGQAIRVLISTDESELTFTPQGVKVADGLIWFDLICTDPACDEAEYLVTEIHP